MIKSRHWVLIWIIFLLVACSNSFESEDELLVFISEESNGYRQSKSINNVDYVLQYKPTDLMVLQEAEGKIDDTLVARLRDKYSKNLYFVLSISKDGSELLNATGTDREMYLQLVNDLTFDMDEKITLLSGMDTIPMLHYSYPRAFGMAKSTSLLLIYPRNREDLKKAYLNMIFKDFGFSTGIVKFKIENDKLINEPSINF